MINYPDASKFDLDSLDKQITMVSTDSTITITNDELVSESLELSESLCSEDYLSFGAVESSRLKFTIKNTIPNTMNKWLDVTIMPYGAQSAFTLGRYKVYSDKVSSDRTTREIIAYDGLYKILSSSYKSWYKSIWGSSDTMTVKQFRDRFFDKIAEKYSWLTQENTTLLNDAVVLKKSKSIPRISGKDVFKAICEINGVFGHLGRDNVFRYVQLGSSGSASNITSNLTITVDHEDFNTTTISKMQILAATGDVLGETGSGDNNYVIENNFLLKGLGDDDAAKDTAQLILSNIYPTVSTITYVPIDAEVKGNPCYEVGDKISLTAHGSTFNTFMLQRELKGVQSLHDNYIASTGEQDYVGSKNANTAKMQKLSDGIGENEKAIELKPDVTVDTDVPDPSMGKTGDIHVQTGTAVHKAPKYEVVWENEERTPYDDLSGTIYPPRDDVFSPTAIVWDEATSSYNMEFYGSVSYHKIDGNNYCFGGIPILRIKNFPHTDGVHHFRMRVESVSYEIIGNNTEADWWRYADHLGLQVRRYQETKSTGFPDPGQVITDTIHFDLGGSGGPYQTDGEISGDGADPNNDYSVKLFVVDSRMLDEDDWDAVNFGRLTITGFKFEIYTDYEQKITDGGYTETEEPYVGDVSVKDPDGNWQTIQRIADIETPTDPEKQEETGLQVTQDTRILSLRKNVMRAAVKSGPPGKSNKPGHNQFRIRYTGKPDSDADITYYGGHGWTVNGKIKHDDNNVYKFSAKGTNISGDVNYCAFKITNLTKNKKYHFNFAAKWNSGTTFGKDYTKGCGVVFNDTGIISTNDWTGNPDTFNENTGYCSFVRNTSKRYYECDFTATASTMYMVLTTADITSTDEHSITFYDFVIGTTARSYMRELYMYDYVTDTWMKYMPFSAVTGGGEEPSGEGSVVTVTPVDPATLNNPIKIADMTVDGDAYAIYAPNGSVINSLDDIGDVEITSPATGQVLKYDSTTQKWINANDSGGGAEAIEITWAAYQALTPAQKADATKVYYITDYPSGGGGGGTGAYTETELYTGTTVPSTITLSSSFQNYDALQFTTGFDYNSTTYLVSTIIPKSDLNTALSDGDMVTMGYSSNNYCFGVVNSNTEFTNCYADGYLYSIKGITYGSGGGGGDSTVRYDENTRYMQVLDHGHWINAYKVPVEYFINKYFTTGNPVNETYTFTEDGKYLVWANTCVNEGSPTSKISTTATVLSQNSESGTDSGYYRVCEYMIVDAVVGDTVTIAASSYDRNSVGVIQLTNGITLSEYAFEFEVDGTASLSKTYEVNERYLVLLLTSGAQRSISGNGNMEQSWSDDENSIDFIERNADTVSYSAYGYAGGAGVIIVFTVS